MLDFRKAFDKVDHKILLSKLVNTVVHDFLISWITNVLYERQQQIKIGSNTSSWSHLKARVLQGILLGSTSFLLHINDLKTICDDEKSVDDTTLWESCNRSGSDSYMQTVADQEIEWMNKTNMELNTDKTKGISIYFGHKALKIVPIKMNGNETKLRGIMINDTITWNNHIDYICGKALCRIYFLILLKRPGKSPSDLVSVFSSLIRSILEYACEFWHPVLTREPSHTIEHLQVRVLNLAFPSLEYYDALNEAGIETLEQKRETKCRQFFFKTLLILTTN